MRIKTIYLENFRGYREKTYIKFSALTAFVGKNDIGKSTILEALDIFFNEGKNIIKVDKTDINVTYGQDAYSIGVCFEHFPDEIVVDSTVSTSLEEEFLLNEEGLLEIKKVFKNGKKSGTFLVANYPVDELLNDIHTLSIAALKKRLTEQELKVEDNRKSSLIRKKMIESIPNKELMKKEIPIDKEGAKQIWSRLENYMPLYELFQSDRKNLDQDDEIQNPMKLLIKEILKDEEIDSRLEEIFEEIKQQAEHLTERTFEKLSEMNPEIAKELKSNFVPPNWASVFKFSVDTDEGISLNKRGSGVRRLILLNFFRAEAERRRHQREVPTVIYAFEEPETSQHPHHQRMLIEAFQELAIDEVNQVILTTHSPSIAKMLDIRSLRFIEKDETMNTIVRSGDENEEILVDISESLGILPNIEAFDVDKVKLAICVEGKNDVTFLKNINKSVPALRNVIDFSDGRILFIPMGGSTLQFWINENYLGKLNLAQFHLYDSDKGSSSPHKYIDYVEIINGRENSIAFETELRELENYIPARILEQHYDGLSLINHHENWDILDVPECIAKFQHNSDNSRAKDWSMLEDKKKKEKTRKVKNKISSECVLNVTEELLKENAILEEIVKWHESILTLSNK